MKNLKKFEIKNRTALITGGGGLFGFEHACALLEVGAFVILSDIESKSLKKNSERLSKIYNKNNFITIKMDVTKESSIKSCLKKIKKIRKKIDILINNASINPTSKKIKNNSNNRLESFSLKNWNKEISVGLTGTFLCSKIFGTEMSKDKKGVIINILSDLSVISPDQRIYQKNNKKINNKFAKPITYSAIKTGMLGLTRYIATYWAHKGIRCNAISPGGIYDNQDKFFVRKLNKLIPLGRMAEKDEYRSAIQFLCSDASSYMNGHNMIMDGERSIW